MPYLHLSPCTQQGEEAAKVSAIKATIFAEPDLANLTEPLEGYLVSSVTSVLNWFCFNVLEELSCHCLLEYVHRVLGEEVVCSVRAYPLLLALPRSARWIRGMWSLCTRLKLVAKGP